MKPTIEQFNKLVDNLKVLQIKELTELEIMNEILPHFKNLMENCSSWLDTKYYQVDIEAGFNGYKIYEDDDHSLAIYITSWLPGRGAPPHNHGMWLVIGGLVGEESNTFWQRVDDGSKEGYAEIKKLNEIICKPGDILTLDSNTIHSVTNITSKVSISMQIYGKHPHFTNRLQFNVDTNETKPFIGKEVD